MNCFPVFDNIAAPLSSMFTNWNEESFIDDGNLFVDFDNPSLKPYAASTKNHNRDNNTTEESREMDDDEKKWTSKSALREDAELDTNDGGRKLIFESCIKNQSGNMDLSGLVFALQSFGLYASKDELMKKMEDLDVHFPLKIATFRMFTEDIGTIQCERGLCTVPHARRGLSLGQLKDIRAGLFDTEWLPSLCQDFNTKHESEIREKKKQEMKPNLYAMKEAFVRKTTMTHDPKTNARNSIPPEVLEDAGVPDAPQANCSFAQLLNKEGLTVDYFVSHCWEQEFDRTVQALENFAGDVFQEIGKKSPDDVVFWLCVFALNQNNEAAEEVGSTLEERPFDMALANAKHGAIMVLDDSAKSMRRIWCLYELYRAKELGKPFELVVDKGRLAKASVKTLEEISEKLLEVCASKADAGKDSDKIKIHHKILDERWKSEYASFESYKLQISQYGVKEFFFENFDQHVCGLIANPLMEAGLVTKSDSVCLRALGMGATVTVDDLKDLNQRHGIDLQGKVETRFGETCSLATVFASSGRAEELEYILDAGAEVNDEDIHGATALSSAAEGGHAEICAILLARGAEVGTKTSTGSTALHSAAEGGHPEVCELFLNHGAAVDEQEEEGGDTPLRLAAVGGHADVCALLLDRGADVRDKKNDGFNALHLAAECGNADVCKLFLGRGGDGVDVGDETDRGSTALLLAAQNGHVETYKLFLEHGANVDTKNKRGFTSLHLAAENGHVDMCRMLLDGSAYISNSANKVDDEIGDGSSKSGLAAIGEKNSTGHTALLLAAQNGHMETYEILLQHGADAGDKTNSGSTSLHLAAENGQEEICKRLLDGGADVGDKRKNGMTALHSAAYQGHSEVCTLLLDCGADMDDKDKRGRTPLHVADQYGHTKLCALLQKRGA